MIKEYKYHEVASDEPESIHPPPPISLKRTLIIILVSLAIGLILGYLER